MSVFSTCVYNICTYHCAYTHPKNVKRFLNDHDLTQLRYTSLLYIVIRAQGYRDLIIHRYTSLLYIVDIHAQELGTWLNIVLPIVKKFCHR